MCSCVRVGHQFEVRSLHSGAVVRNVSSPAALLTLTSLPSATDFTITVYRYSLQGSARWGHSAHTGLQPLKQSLIIGGPMENFWWPFFSNHTFFIDSTKYFKVYELKYWFTKQFYEMYGPNQTKNIIQDV